MAEYISFQPSDFFNTVLWTGTGVSNAITDVGFQPDFVWGKKRNAAYFPGLFDSVRGATKYLQSDVNAAEVTNAESLKTFDVNGFTAGTIGVLNEDAATYVGWNWKAGTTSGLSGGTITPSSYSFSTTNGFGIYKYTGNSTSGATIAHGLGATPKFIIIKRTDTTGAWMVYHQGMGNTKYMSLDTDIAEATSASAWNDTSPTSTLFSLGDGSNVNNSSGTYVAYVFAPIKGYSKFGTYTGNGNNDGPFLYTGFRPNFVMIKRLSGGDNGWAMWDVKRNTYNPADNNLQAQWNNGENYVDAGDIDIVSNGFKIVVTDNDTNVDGYPYIYMAFSEFPIVSSNDIPGVAR